MESLWFVRVLTTPPHLPARTVASFAGDYPIEERQTISQTTVTRARDAWCEVVKDLTDHAVLELGRKMDGKSTVFLTHVHDETCLRMRSWATDLGAAGSRGRTSTVQNQCLSVHCQNESIVYYVELAEIPSPGMFMLVELLVELGVL